MIIDAFLGISWPGRKYISEAKSYSLIQRQQQQSDGLQENEIWEWCSSADSKLQDIQATSSSASDRVGDISRSGATRAGADDTSDTGLCGGQAVGERDVQVNKHYFDELAL